MLPRRLLVLVGLPLSVWGCSFDSGGLQTGSNSQGTLESSGSEAGEAETSATMTSTTAGTSVTTTSDPTVTTTVTSADTTNTGTTMPGTTEPGTTETGTDTDATATTTTGVSATTESTTTTTDASQGSSSDSGSDLVPYGMCMVDPDCGDGQCVALYLDAMTAMITHHVCYPPCIDDLDCPAPDGGTAQPFCTQSGCALACYMLTCPAGMECVENSDGYHRCGWAD
jgi:hypothetical protein